MSAALTQDKRIAELTTPLGKDVLVLARFEGSEGLSELFEYRIEALSERENLDFDQALGRPCTVKFKNYGSERTFSGILVEAQWRGAEGEYYSYNLVLRPWLWLASRTADCRLFLDKDAPTIIKDVFKKRGFTDFRDSLTESYPKLEYCVQYRETDMAFACRLMEQHGIYYFFEHSDGKHTMVLCDSKSSHKPVPGLEKVSYIPLAGQDRRGEQHIYDWSTERRFRTGKYELNDYDFKQPNANLISDAKAAAQYAKSDLEIYDYPGKYKQRSDGEKYAKVRLEADQGLDQHRYARGDAVSLFPGGLTSLQKHGSGPENTQYLIVHCSHSYVAEEYRSGGGSTHEQIYFGHYQFLKSDKIFRAPLVTPKPIVFGPQTAKVVGKEGEEIDVDEYGRIKLQFHWDREKQQSIRVRVAQVWSGKQWGGQVIPRIGQEAVVEFLEGDPDRPLVVGTVYNKDYMPPYEMPSNKTQSGLKSNSSKGGGGYNEWMFEDKKDEEKIGVHAEKDMNVVVRNIETREIGNKFKTAKGQSSRITQLKNGDDELSVDKGNQKVKIGADQTVDVEQNIAVTAGKSIELKVGASTIKIDGSSITIKSMNIKVDGTITQVNGSATLTLQGGLVKIN
jgi:type VI secretion system secreted protein VgrG